MKNDRSARKSWPCFVKESRYDGKRKLEVLAPAGSFESLKAAVSAGADAVYMGGGKFGARAYAQNPEGKIFWMPLIMHICMA